jgi:hypothetical protein
MKAALQQMECVRVRSIAVSYNCPLWPCHLKEFIFIIIIIIIIFMKV